MPDQPTSTDALTTSSIKNAAEIFRSFPRADEEELLKRMVEGEVDYRIAEQLLALMPLAYGRVMLSESKIVFSDVYLVAGSERKARLSNLPLWREVVEYASRDTEPAFPIASRSPEVRAANEALKDGSNLTDLVWGPPVFVWPLELTGKGGPSWLRQIWDSPALHSMSETERRVARAAMIVALSVGVIAVSAVAYYAIIVFL